MDLVADFTAVMLDAGDGDDVARGQSRELALVEGGNPPSEYLMFGPGITETVKGPLLFDEEAAAAVMEFYEGRGRKRIAGDWEHDSMVPASERPPNYRGSPASHWFEPSVRPGPELWAANVKWTPDAFEQIRKGEYAHTSPVVKFQKSTGRIVAVLSCALTNDPATIGQPQLVAATATLTPEKTMKFKLSADHAMKMKALADAEHESPEHAAGAFKACLAESMPEHFHKEPDGDEAAMKARKLADEAGKPDAGAQLKRLADGMAKEFPGIKLDVDPGNWAQNAAVHIKSGATHSEPGSVSHNSAMPDEEKKEMTALRADLARLTGKQDRTAQVATLTAWKHASEDVASLSAKSVDVNKQRFAAIVEQGRKAMKLTPADCAEASRTRAGQYIASLGRDEQGIVALTAYLEAVGLRVTTAETATREAETADLSTVRLSVAEVDSCEKNGTDKAAYLANKKKHIAEGTAPRF